MAEAVPAAIASGSMSSFELTAKIVTAVLTEPVMSEAVELDRLLRTRSPFSLVRAVALAESGTAEDETRQRPVYDQGAHATRAGA